MKILVIPDQHGINLWKKMAEENYDKADAIVQLGDWFDSFDKKLYGRIQIANFNDACNFAKKNPKFHICIGNHDLSYLSEPHVSGHQNTHHIDIGQAILNNIDLLNVAYEFDGVVFSHAGFTKTWMKNHGFTKMEEANTAFHEKAFSIFDWDGYFDGYGDEVSQGPLWVRPNSLIRDSFFSKQVVGHTEMIKQTYIVDGSKEFVLCDTESHSDSLLIETLGGKLSFNKTLVPQESSAGEKVYIFDNKEK